MQPANVGWRTAYRCIYLLTWCWHQWGHCTWSRATIQDSKSTIPGKTEGRRLLCLAVWIIATVVAITSIMLEPEKSHSACRFRSEYVYTITFSLHLKRFGDVPDPYLLSVRFRRLCLYSSLGARLREGGAVDSQT